MVTVPHLRLLLSATKTVVNFVIRSITGTLLQYPHADLTFVAASAAANLALSIFCPAASAVSDTFTSLADAFDAACCTNSNSCCAIWYADFAAAFATTA